MKCRKKCESKDRKKLAEYDMSTGLCIYCNKDVEEGVECGKLLTDKNRELFVHKYCLLFASGLPQAGADTEGIEGFLVQDILREYRRSRKLNCSYCHKKTATIGCSLSVCRRGFHFNCGVKNEALFCFFDTFLAYCQHHRAQQDVQVSESDPATVTCPICFEDVEARVSNHTLKTPCCTNTWFHRNCIQRQALSAGYFFRCAICNNQEQFQIEMKKFGIYIPEHDASWEMEDNAFQELYWRHDKCDFDPCACPEGRQFNKASSKWELLLCDLCGSSGCHLACGGLKSANQDWACAMCNAMMSNATEVSCPSSASPQKSPSQGGDSPTKTGGQTTRTAMKLMGKHPRTPLSSHTFRKKTATSPFSSLKLPNSPDEIADSFLDNGGNVRKSSFEPPDLVVSFEHCQPSTSKQGLEDADCKHKNGKKRKLSHCSKENDLNHYVWKIQAADQLNNKMSASSSGLIYGPRTTLRMSMRPRKIALLQCSHDSTSEKSITYQTRKQSLKNPETFCRAETISSPTSNTPVTVSVTEEICGSYKVLATDNSKNVNISHSPDEELPVPARACSSGAIATFTFNGLSVNKSMVTFPKESLVADKVGLKTRKQTSFWKKSQNATVTCPIPEEPLSCLADKLASVVSSQKPALLDETGNGTSKSSREEFDDIFSCKQQSNDDLDVLKPPSFKRYSCSPTLVEATSDSKTEQVAALTEALADYQLSSHPQTYVSGYVAKTDAITVAPKEEADCTYQDITGQADAENNLEQAQSITDCPKNDAPLSASSKLKKTKSFAYRYASFGQRWKKQLAQSKKKQLAQSRRQSASLGDETKSQLPAVHTDNPRTGKEDENSATSLPLAETDVLTPRQSPLYPENDSSLEESPKNVSGCSSTLFDFTGCVLSSGSENVIKPQEQHHVHVGAELQEDVLVQSAVTTPCPSPHSSRHCAGPLKQSSPCGQTSHSPYYTSPDHRVSSVFPPNHPENSSQQTVDSMGGKSNLIRPESTETLIKGQVKVESGDPSPNIFSYDVSEYSSVTSDVPEIKCPKKASSKLKKTKTFAYRYASFGQRWKKRLAQSRRQSASLGDETKSQFPAVHTDNLRTGKEDENGATHLPLAEAKVPTIRKSPPFPENDSSLEECSANVSECASTLIDLTDCVFALPSGSDNVTKPQEQHHVGADLQDDDVLVQSADTTQCPSPHFTRHCASPPKQSSPCGQTSHSPNYTSPDHWVSSVLPPDHPENVFQQTVDSMGGKSNLTRPDSTETMIKGQVKVDSGDLSPKKFSYADDIKELKPELLSVPLPQISTFQTVEYLQRASMRIKLPESVKPEDGQSHLVSTQGSISKTDKCPSSEVQQLINGDAICRDINIGCRADHQLGRKEALRSQKSKKQKSSKLPSKYPVIGTGRYATLHNQKIKRKLQRKATSSKCVQPQRKHATGTCQLRPCQNDKKKPESQGEVRLSTGMLLRKRVSLNKESVPSHNTENAGGKSAWPSITVQESSCINLTDNSRVEVISSSEGNTIPTTPSNNFQAVRNQFEIRECRNSRWVDSFSAQGRYCGLEIQGAKQSTGKLLRRKYIRDHAETAQDSASREEERGIERERPGPVFGNQAQETAQSPDGSQSGTTESNTTHDKTISTLPANETGDDIAIEELASKSETLSSEISPDSGISQGFIFNQKSGDETGGDIAIEEPASKSETLSSETSSDSGISQGFVCNQEETPPGKPCLTPTMINKSALVNLEEIHSDSEETSDQPFALAQSRKSPPGSDASNDMIPGCKNITIKIDASDDDFKEIDTESKEKSFQPFALAQSRNSSPNTPESDASNVLIPESKIITIENDASDDDVILIESTYFEPVKTKSVLNDPVSERSQTASPTAIVRSSSYTPKSTESPQTVGSDSKCSLSDIPQCSGDSIPNPNPLMKLNFNLLPQTSISTVMPGTPPIKPIQMEPSLTFSGRDGGCSPRLRDTSNKPMSCPGKCQSGKDSEILEKSHRLLRKRRGQNLSSRVCANLYKVMKDQGRPLKRPRIDILTRPVSPLVSGNDVLFSPRNNKTTIYVSNLSKTTSQKEIFEADSPKSRQAGSSSGGGIPEQCLADCESLKMSTSLRLLTLTAESPQRPWLLRSQTKKGPNVCSAESASPLPSRGGANVRHKAKVYLPNSLKVGPSIKLTQDSSGSMPQANCNPQPDGGPLGTNPSSSPAPRADSHQEGITSRPLLLCSRSKKEAKSSVSPLCSPLPSSQCSSSPKQPRIYRSLPPRSTSNQRRRQKNNASSAPMLEKRSRCPAIKPCSPENLCPPSLSPVFLPNLSSGRRCSTGPPKLSRQEDLTDKSSKGRVQLFKS